ncbi:MAG: polyprenyl synthetase family protein [Acidimicrobiia bacterium]|nr:polyprenyl synthetase family protein [Acidimicrobiia bacterium]MYH05915.1 polyprenyl synthetase family protein [Acidimicrobiia bacterium]MYK56838.1 polyprenyl synthetase family protein [Acidimicrobiia bacterium]
MDDLRHLIDIPHIWARLVEVEGRLLELSSSESLYTTEISQHLLRAGGKRLRPLLALLAATLGPADDRRAVEAAAAVELIHVGSLYHDDVIDESDTRRGAPSVNANWNNTLAVLAGDFLISRGSEVAATYLDIESVRMLAITYTELVEGQALEFRLIGRLDHDLPVYRRLIDQKTASLIRTSAYVGARAGDASADVGETLTLWAFELGRVFQIADDALDLVATTDVLGKPAGADIREGTFTLPVLLAVRGKEGPRIVELLGRPPPYPEEAVEEVIGLVHEGGYVDRALSVAVDHASVASRALARLPVGETTRVLERMGRYLIERVETARQGL